MHQEHSWICLAPVQQARAPDCDATTCRPRPGRRIPFPHPSPPAPATPAPQAPAAAAGEQVLSQLRRIIDPDFGEDIVACGFVKDLEIDQGSGAVAFKLELTTPACPVKDQFKREATAYVQVGAGRRPRLPRRGGARARREARAACKLGQGRWLKVGLVQGTTGAAPLEAECYSPNS